MKNMLVKFKTIGKTYYFSIPFEVKVGDKILIETEQGIEIGRILEDMKNEGKEEVIIEKGEGVVLRKMTNEDEEKINSFKDQIKRGIDFCHKKIKELKLPMKLIDAELSLDEKKLTFYFTAAERIDFRQLVQELVSNFHKNIRLQQMGPRDAAKILGGIGPCGRPLCCQNFLENIESVTLDMAKEQDLASVGSGKISGVCGKLMCCLSYEAKAYQKMRKQLPKIGSEIKTDKGKGRVVAQSVLKQSVLVKLEDGSRVEIEGQK